MDVDLTGAEFKNMAGAFAAMFTPFDRKGRVNEEAIDALVEHGLKGGLKGFYLTGSTGEGMLLTNEERRIVYRRAVKAAKGRCKLIAQVGCVRTDDAVALAKAAADAGVDWISSVAPVYFGQNFPSAMRHYKAISEATDLPFLIYAFNSTLVPERDVRLFGLKNVKGIKYTGRDFYACQRLRRMLDKATIWFAGCDELLIAVHMRSMPKRRGIRCRSTSTFLWLASHREHCLCRDLIRRGSIQRVSILLSKRQARYGHSLVKVACQMSRGRMITTPPPLAGSSDMCAATRTMVFRPMTGCG